MGALDRFEQSLDRLVNGAFAKAFRSEVQPVEIASALTRELDEKAVPLGPGRTVGPNTFTVELGPRDHDRLAPYAQPLGAELASMVREHADAGGVALLGPVEVSLTRVDRLSTGMFRVISSTTPGVTAQPQRRPLHEPPPAQPAQPAQPAAGPLASPAVQPASPMAPHPEPSGLGAPGAPAPLPTEFEPYPAPVAVPVPSVHDVPAAPIEYEQVQRQPVDVAPAEQPVPVPVVAPAPVQANPRLVVHGTAYPLTKNVVTIGRGADVDIRIDDPGVSRRHASFHLGEPCSVVDLASTNGTFVGGHRIAESPLRDGDEVRVGSTTLVYRVG